MSDPEIIADLAPAGILEHISPPDLESLKFYGAFGEYASGEVLMAQGDEQFRLYVIISGTLDVYVLSGTDEIHVGRCGPGDSIGEVAIFEPGPASATVKISEHAVLWHLDVDALQNFFEQLPIAGGQLMLGISQLLSKRLRTANMVILQNRVLPQHLGIRASGFLKEPIKADTLSKLKKSDAKKSGFFSLFGKK